MTEQKIKIKVRTSTEETTPKKETTTQNHTPQIKKGLIRKVVDIVYSDIKNFPEKIFGKKETIMISKDTWEDWEGQL
jgi:hypothetical protein